MENPLIDAWLNCPLRRPPYCLPDDFEIIRIKSQRIEVNSFQEFINSSDFGHPSGKFHLGLIPQPFIGNLEASSIFLLTLNPGFSPGDYYAIERSKDFRKAAERNLRQENGNDDYPFFYLNPAFSWTPGGIWWQNKLRPIAQELQAIGICSDIQAAYQLISKSVACLELFPYYSSHFTQHNLKLKSTDLLKNYVSQTLVPKAKKGNALLIATRQAASWKLPVHKNVVVYGSGAARAASLGLDSPGGSRIAEWLRSHT